ncbi:hypothetical protein Anas_11429 [Armadillidium nasatum]|uniref:Uncharacterized protein n=1 Tax=Armadillidium nasatum TaxID=96803 RepID=A0A5N5TBQ1_9CRUS|nr:hypothetical protein Anas_11429 [Armadillidium nasatum]
MNTPIQQTNSGCGNFNYWARYIIVKCWKCNVKGVWTGFITSTVLILWISLGSFLYKKPLKFLSFSSDECDYSNFTSENTRNQKSHETSPKFICPYVRKFYWSEEEISLFEKEHEDKPLSYNRNVDENHFEQELENLQNSKDC